MKKHYCVYKDEKVERFNHVTKVTGTTSLKKDTVRAMYEGLVNLLDAFTITDEEEGYTVKVNNGYYDLDIENPGFKIKVGISKCSPEDTYDEKTGLVVASRKAELKGNKAILTEITAYRKEVEKYFEFIKDIEDRLDYKVGKLSLNLAAMNNRGSK